MSTELLCPNCGHPLGFHSYDIGKCEAPIGGINMQEMCGCELTLYDIIQDLKSKDHTKEIETLKQKNQDIMKEVEQSYKILVAAEAQMKCNLARLENVKAILEEAKLVDVRSLGGAFVLSYKKKIHELLDKAILEMEDKHG